jgi:hypothetical protein
VVTHQQGRQGNQTRRIQASLLSLPVELRLAIYEHLIPNNQVPPNNDSKPPLRHDEQPCCPAVLRVNRQIYNEVISMWYGTARFWVKIAGRFLNALRVKIDDRNATLPSNFRLIRSLSITLMLHWPPLGQPQCSFENHAPWTKLIADVLSAGPYRLSDVDIRTVIFYPSQLPAITNSYLDDRGNQVKVALEWNLGPLRMMRGVNLRFGRLEPLLHKSGMFIDSVSGDSGQSRRVVLQVFARLERIRARFLERLVDDVSQNA